MAFPSCAALIPAAGQGERLGLGPKALLKLGGRTLLEHLVRTIEPLVNSLVVAAPPVHLKLFKEILGSRCIVVEGGKTRQKSVDNLLMACTEDILLIQDVARPFASRQLCSDVILAASEHGAAGAFLDMMVPVGCSDSGFVTTQWDRGHARLFQAPQAFRREIMVHARAVLGNQEFQSTAQMVLEAGFTMKDIPGSPENIKITTELDWLIAQRIIAPQLGFDSTLHS